MAADGTKVDLAVDAPADLRLIQPGRRGAHARGARRQTPLHRRRVAGLGGRFQRLLAATGCSSVGDGLAIVAFPLLVVRYTHDPVLIAGVALADRIPAVMLALPAGVLADRWSRRVLAVTAQWVRLIVLGVFGALLALGAGSLLAVYATVFVIGCMEQVYQAAAFASLPAIVEPDRLGRANSRLAAAQMGGEQVAGQSLGGIALAVSRALPFVVDATSFGLGALLLGGAIPPGRVEREHAHSLRRDLADGLRWFADHPVLPTLAALIGSFAFSQFMMIGIFVLYARLSLHLSSAGYGFLMAGAAVGNVIGALLAGRLADRLGPIGATLLAGGVAGAAYIGLGSLRTLVGAAVFLAVENLAVPVGLVASIGLRQELIPRALLGRVGMVFRVIVYGAMPLGALTGGLLAGGMPYEDVFLVAGGLQLVVVVVLGPHLWSRSREAAEPIRLDDPGPAPG